MGKINRTKRSKVRISNLVKRQSKEKQLLLEQFKKTPIIQVACEKTNIGRATYYRWKKEDPDFAKLADESLMEGNSLINDMAESQLISAIQDKNLSAIVFWLKHHHSSYTTKIELTTIKDQEINLTDEQKELLNKALEMAALTPNEPKTNG